MQWAVSCLHPDIANCSRMSGMYIHIYIDECVCDILKIILYIYNPGEVYCAVVCVCARDVVTVCGFGGGDRTFCKCEQCVSTCWTVRSVS